MTVPARSAAASPTCAIGPPRRVELAVVEVAYDYPAYGQVRAATKLLMRRVDLAGGLALHLETPRHRDDEEASEGPGGA